MIGPPRRFWQDMTTREFAQLETREGDRAAAGRRDRAARAASAGRGRRLHQSGQRPARARAAAGRCAAHRPAHAAGRQERPHLAFPGTLTLSAATLARLWTEMGEAVARAGIRKLLLFNSHGGQPQVMEIVARDLRVRLGMTVVAYSWFAGLPAGLFPDDEVRHGIHAGAIETSMMLHLRPDLVPMDHAADFVPLAREMAGEGYRLLSPSGPGRLAWQAQDLPPSGACGDATDADAARGRLLVDHAAEMLVELLLELDRFSPGRLRPGQT